MSDRLPRANETKQRLDSNATKYTEEGETVWVRAYRETDGAAMLEVEETGIADP